MLKDYRETIYYCLKCGACKVAYGPFMPICPSGLKYGFESHYAVGRMEIAKGVLDNSLKLDSNLMKRIYTCTSCGGCDEQCGTNMGVFPLRVIEELKSEAIEKGVVPAEVRDFLENVNNYGNPWCKNPKSRGEWAQEIGIDAYSGHEFLFYVGCVGSYDDRGEKIAQDLGRLFIIAGVDFGILGSKEICDGNEVNRVGERGLFQELAERNIKTFKDKGIKKIVTLSPHGFNAMKNDYPAFGGEFEVFHYTQLLNKLVKSKKLKLNKQLKIKVTYHDSCFLGRHNSEYEAPRELLSAIPGLELVEMEMSRENAFCCGGGGGNFFTDIIGGGPRRPDRVRVRQALEAGAQVIAVACPICAKMLEDAIKVEELEDRIAVKDISEILGESCSTKGISDRDNW